MAVGIGNRRCRISLFSAEKQQGTGGRLLESTPLIADVWASMSDQSLTLAEAGGRQSQKEEMRFQLPYEAAYMQAKFIELGTTRYRVQRVSRSGEIIPLLSFSVVSL